MPHTSATTAITRLIQELSGSEKGLPHLWGARGFWQIKLRWGVAPVMLAGILVGWWIGFEFPVLPVVFIALGSLAYNAVFAWIYSRYSGRLERESQLDRLFTMVQVVVDYAAMFLLIYFTGGVSSPLVTFFLFHVIIASIQFRPSTAYSFAAMAVGGLWLMLAGQMLQWLPFHCITFHGLPVHFMDRPAYAFVMLLFFSATVMLTATMATEIMKRLRARVQDLAVATEAVSSLNDKLNSLYAMVCAIGAERHLEPILDTVTFELVKVMEVAAVAVKLLDEDGRTLRYVAAHGLPQEFVETNVVHIDHSPLNRRVIEGETLVHGRVSGDDTLQVEEELAAIGIESAVLAPLTVENRVIGTLGAYCHVPYRFQDADTDFLQMAAALVAIAIDNARAYEAIEDLMRERTQFMLEVAHNMRAPLGAGLSMMDLVKDGYLGDVTPEQAEHLARIEARLRALHQMVGELLTIARTRDRSREIPDVVVDMRDLADYTERTYREQAARKDLEFAVQAEDDLPKVDSGADLLEQVMDNLVSNAIKYTPEGGEVEVTFSRRGPDEVRIMVRDTGIGIPAADQGKLFREFYRASNAKKLSAAGTGLGLTLVKQTVERHNGRLHLASQEGQGTTVVVDLPIRQ